MKHIILICFIASFTKLYAQIIPDYIPTENLLGWWPLDSDANDYSGNDNHGLAYGATHTVNRFGMPDHAYAFNGIDQYITGNISGLSSLVESTLIIWVKYTGDAGGQPYDSYFQIGDYGVHTFTYGYNYSNQNLDFYSHCTGGVPSYPEINLNNEWHFIAIVDNETGTAIYIDGTLFDAGTGGTPGECYQGNSTFQIGGGSDNQWVTGCIDDVGFWDRALTASEILTIYEGCTLSITENPNDTTASVGDNVTFMADASVPGVNFQWQSDLGFGFEDLSDFGQYSGTTSNLLTIESVTLTNNNQGFRCITFSDFCADTSASGLLTVLEDASTIPSYTNPIIQIYPIPATTSISLNLTDTEFSTEYQIFDVAGRLLQAGQVYSFQNTITISNLDSGLYLLAVTGYGNATILKL